MGFIQLLSDKPTTIRRSTALMVFPVNAVLLNIAPRKRNSQ